MRTAVLTALALVAFAANSVLCRLALSSGGIDAATFSLVRFAGGAAALLLIGGASLRRMTWSSGWPSASALFLYAMPFALSYNRLSAGTGALILFGSVQVTMIAAALGGGERPRLLQWVGLGVALAGLVYLVWPGLTGPPLSAAGLMTLGGVAWGVYSLRGRRSAHPLLDTTKSFAQVVPLLLVVCLITLPELHATRTGLLLAAASGVFASGIGYVIWYSALGGLTATRAAVVQLAVPVLAATGGMMFLGESVSERLMGSAVLILGGIALALLG
jgi:drug/metabolite transporter (DMT)-like permease